MWLESKALKHCNTVLLSLINIFGSMPDTLKITCSPGGMDYDWPVSKFWSRTERTLEDWLDLDLNWLEAALNQSRAIELGYQWMCCKTSSVGSAFSSSIMAVFEHYSAGMDRNNGQKVCTMHGFCITEWRSWVLIHLFCKKKHGRKKSCKWLCNPRHAAFIVATLSSIINHWLRLLRRISQISGLQTTSFRNECPNTLHVSAQWRSPTITIFREFARSSAREAIIL